MNGNSTAMAPAIADESATQQAAEKYGNLTKHTVEKIHGMVKKQISSWLELGRTVDQYVETVTEHYSKSVDGYRLLERCPGSKLTASMLRKCHGAYRLALEVEKKKGRSLDLSMSHMLVVLHRKCTLDEQIALLEEAERNRLSVSDFKTAVAGSAGSGGESGIDSERAIRAVERAIAKCTSALSDFDDNVRHGGIDVPGDIHDSLIDFLRVVISRGFLSIAAVHSIARIPTKVTPAGEERNAA